MRYQKVIRGRDSLNKIPQLMEKLEMKRPLLVGSERLLGTLLRKAPMLLNCPVFSGYHPNPDLADSRAGAELYRRSACDGLIAIGGGSCLDTAKAIKARLNTENEDDLLHSRLKEDGVPCPQIAVPGTAGSGAEATENAVVYVEGRKVSLSRSIIESPAPWMPFPRASKATGAGHPRMTAGYTPFSPSSVCWTT